MNLLHILILSIVQGAAELLPVSSSAHVIVAEKLLGLDPTAPAMTLLLVMLHTGTMLAVIVYFWRAWRDAWFGSWASFLTIVIYVGLATAITGVVGLGLQEAIRHGFAGGRKDFEIEQLFGDARLMAGALAAAGVLILVSSRFPARDRRKLSLASSALIGAVQGLCLPFRGFSRSGATISTGLALGISRRRAEEFSFALAVALTPVVVLKEGWRLVKAPPAAVTGDLGHILMPCMLGMALSFAAGLAALRWLSNWLEHGRWGWFGVYCLLFAAVVLWVG